MGLLLKFFPGLEEYKLIFEVGFLASIFVAGLATGYMPAHNEYISYKAKVEQQAKDESVIALNKDKANQELFRRTKSDYQSQLAAATAHIRVLLRMRHANVCRVPQESEPASGIAQASPNTLPDYNKLATDCTKTTVMLVNLQNFVKRAQ